MLGLRATEDFFSSTWGDVVQISAEAASEAASNQVQSKKLKGAEPSLVSSHPVLFQVNPATPFR